MDGTQCTVYEDKDGKVLAQLCDSVSSDLRFDWNGMGYNAPLRNTPEWHDYYYGADHPVVDEPWYQDALDWVSGPAMVNGAPMAVWQVIMLICFASLCGVLTTVVMSKFTSVGALSAEVGRDDATSQRETTSAL